VWGAEALDTEHIVQQNEQAVVVILGTKTGSSAPVQSSGCYVDSSGLILTTAHQVRHVDGLRAKCLDGAERSLSVVALDNAREIALLRTDRPPRQVARIGDAQLLRSGSPLVAIATPQNLDFSTVAGIVSNTNRTYRGYHVLQTNLAASPGSSGGPVFDERGMLIGVIIGKLRDQEWVTVVNPINNAYRLLREHGVPVPEARDTEPDEVGEEIIPAAGATRLEVEAIRAYNRGVGATTTAEKIEEYRCAVKLIPGFFEAWFNLAVAYGASGDLVEAVAAYREAEKLRPDSAEVQRNLGRVLLKQKAFQAALACFERALACGPTASSHNDVGEAHRQMNESEKAEQSFLSALQLDPQYAAARFNLALTYAAEGRADKAIESFQQYLALAPNAPDAEDVQAMIRRLQQDQP